MNQPPCECGHPYGEHDEIATPTLSDPDKKLLVCMHIDRIPNSAPGLMNVAACACSNYRPAEAATTNPELWV